jgi:hypothetical protein
MIDLRALRKLILCAAPSHSPEALRMVEQALAEEISTAAEGPAKCPKCGCWLVDTWPCSVCAAAAAKARVEQLRRVKAEYQAACADRCTPPRCAMCRGDE